MFKRLDPFGNPNVGVYVRTTSRHLWVPLGLTKKNRADLEEALCLEPIEVSIGGSTLIGSLVAANKTGCVVADIATDAELDVFRGAGLKVMRLEHSRLNAAGNNLLVNDQGAIAHPDLPASDIEAISTAFGVRVERGAIAGVPTVGTAGVATDLGAIVHPLASEEELGFIKRALHVPARIGTVNHGHGLVGAGMTANAAGVAVGSRTTGIELGRIEEALGFLENKETTP